MRIEVTHTHTQTHALDASELERSEIMCMVDIMLRAGSDVTHRIDVVLPEGSEATYIAGAGEGAA